MLYLYINKGIFTLTMAKIVSTIAENGRLKLLFSIITLMSALFMPEAVNARQQNF